MRTRVLASLLACLLTSPLLVPTVAAADPDGPTTPQATSAGATAGVVDERAEAPDWAHEAVIYHVFVDRFADGDQPDQQVARDPDPEVYAEQLKDWMGGDLAGLRQRLDHVEAVGANTLWLSPVYPSPYSHAYHPMDFLDVDDRFGDLDELRALVDDAHDRGIRVVYDLVPNHTSNQHPWFVDAQADCEDSAFFSYYDFTDCPDEYRTFFGIEELPELDLDDPELRAYVLDEVVPFYLDDIGIDGFRLDHAKGPEENATGFWEDFRDAVHDVNPDAWTFGEIWDSREVIAGYQDVLGGAIDFPVRGALTSAFRDGGNVALVDRAVRANAAAYGDGFLPVSYLSSHDEPRVRFLLDDADRVALAATAQFTLPGVPLVYYGDEVGLSQSADHDDYEDWRDRWYREPMPWDPADQDAELLATFTDLAELRTATPALIHGDYDTVAAADGLLAYERALDEDRYLVVLNNADTREVALHEVYGEAIPDGVTLTDAISGEVVTATGGELDLDLGATDAAILAVDGDLPAAPGPVDGPGDGPSSVVLAGDLQGQLGCPGDWQADCDATALTYDVDGDVWLGTFELAAGRYEYKVALNGDWGENYGAGGVPDGANIVLELDQPTTVTFLFSHHTGWVGNDHDHPIATLPGTFNDDLGCPDHWMPACLRTWLQDPDGDGVYTFTTSDIPPGEHEAKVAVGRSWNENYGQNGDRDGPNIPFTVPAADTEITFAWNATTKVLTIDGGGGPPGPDLAAQRAHFVTSDLIAWPFAIDEATTYRLHHAPEGGLTLGDGEVVGGEAIELDVVDGGLPTEVSDRDGFRHLAGRAALSLDGQLDDADLDAWLTGQLAVSATSSDGELVAATGLQLPGVLDERFAADDVPLGPGWDGDVPSLGLWAPTAKNVRVHLFDELSGGDAREVVDLDADGGFWSVTGQPAWDRDAYLFEVEVYVPTAGEVVTALVTDPYSLSLAADSTRSQLVQLSDDDLAPSGWDGLDKPAFAGQEDMVVYELHVRDFSANDPTVPEGLRGTYSAFTLDDTDGRDHLRSLSDAGLTHLHLLPVNDIATVRERAEDRTEPTIPDDLPPNSDEQQRLVGETRDLDAFNWGYDPYHYTTPEGSYATDPEGPTRIREFREMVAALNDDGLRVVVDVVYNHTNASGQAERSVLDRIVPGYYHRLDDRGVVETSTCCPNTATEHAMMERLTVDSVVTWARDHKVDGFRFDLMGHHPKAQMLRVRDALDELTLEEDGVDGEAIVLYGEGWNFGEVENDARFVQATQANLAGTGIGTFSDRLRDAARGGNPFGGLQEQGFLTGLATDPNDTDQGSDADVEARARAQTDLVRLGIAGNLADYAFETSDGQVRAGRELDYNGQAAGYTQVPSDHVVYVSKHDNETLFDAIQYKLPRDTSPAERARVQNLGLSTVMFSQGTPFFHAGSDLLRSKSLDRDSYDSGDWFNRIDWSRQTNNWGVGLPPAWSNSDNWPLMGELLGELPGPAPADIEANAAHFQELLAVRASTDLFRLPTLEAVQEQLAFHATGPDAPLGSIVYSLSGGQPEPDDDHAITDVLVVINTAPDALSLPAGEVPGGDWQLHPVLAGSADPRVRTATVDGDRVEVAARTTAVFVQLADDDGPGGPGEPGEPGEPEPPTFCPTANTPRFTDLASSLHGDAIRCLAGLGVVRGYPDGTFRPRQPVTRAQTASFFSRLVETLELDLPRRTAPSLNDLRGGPHESAILDAAAQGLILGHPDGTFRPGEPLTRGQLASMVVRLHEAAIGATLPAGGSPFSDVAGSPHERAIVAAQRAGLLRGYPDGTYRPGRAITRDQLVAILAALGETLHDWG